MTEDQTMGEGTDASVDATSDETVNLPFLVQDRLYLRPSEHPPEDDVLFASPLGTVTVRGEGPFRDGPAVGRVAIVDRDITTGVERPGARLAPRRGRRRSYEIDVDLDADSPVEAFESVTFIQLSCFATVMRTIMFFEGPDAVGRRIPWACGPTLSVLPRAGQNANAFYNRASASLRFFSFQSAAGYAVHAALSHDIVSHETAHALLDGLAPDLYNAMTPQSLAIHEALADLAAIALTLLNEQIVFSLLAISGAGVQARDVGARVADEFGANSRHGIRASYLRSADNARTLDPADRSVDAVGVPNAVDRANPHALSEVLSGAIFGAFADRFAGSDERGIALAARRMARMVFRALDHLPPGELSLADVGRAIVAADAAASGKALDRTRVIDEFVRRGIVASDTELETPIRIAIPPISDGDLDAILDDEAAARVFVERHRTLFGIPDGRTYEVVGRHVLGRSRKGEGRQVAIRVRWTNLEEHDLGPGFARQWAVPGGATAVIEAGDGGRAVTVLRSDDSDALRLDRDENLRRMVASKRITPRAATAGPAAGDAGSALDGGMPAAAFVVLDEHGAQQLSGTGSFLHSADE